MIPNHWIPLYTDLLNNPIFGRLDDKTYRVAISLMIVASSRGRRGTLPTLNRCFKEVTKHWSGSPGEKYEAFYACWRKLVHYQIIKVLDGEFRLDFVYQEAIRNYQGGVWLDEKTRDFVIWRDGGACRYCGKPFQHIDHIFPKIQGGGNDPENLVCACAYCNIRKGGRTPEEAGMVLLEIPAG